MKLPPGWYAIMSSDELTSFKPVGIKRFGVDLVVWRDEHNQPIVMDDRCPHRSAKLSLGKIKESRLQCPFHGFEYDTIGRCQHVPETSRAAEYLRVETFHVVEDHGLIWVFHGPGKAQGIPPWFESLDDSLIHSQFTDLWPCHITRCIENQLDYAHLPYVHSSSIGQFADVTKKPETEMNDSRIKVRPNAEKGSGSFIEYRFPNIWQNLINDRFIIFLAFAPVDNETTCLYLRTYYRGLNIPLYKDLVDWFFNITNGIILAQDKTVVVSQGSGSSLEASRERLFLSDVPIRFFRDKWHDSSVQIGEKDQAEKNDV